MAKSKYPSTLFITQENAGEEDSYYSASKTASEALETTDGNTVAEYSLVRVRKGEMVPQFDDE